MTSCFPRKNLESKSSLLRRADELCAAREVGDCATAGALPATTKKANLCSNSTKRRQFFCTQMSGVSRIFEEFFVQCSCPARLTQRIPPSLARPKFVLNRGFVTARCKTLQVQAEAAATTGIVMGTRNGNHVCLISICNSLSMFLEAEHDPK